MQFPTGPVRHFSLSGSPDPDNQQSLLQLCALTDFVVWEMTSGKL